MIPQAKLDALPVATLIALKAQIDATIQHRQRTTLRYGSICTFPAKSRGGRQVTISVTGFGPKNVMGIELDAMGKPTTMKWRVHPTHLTPVGEANKPRHAAAGSF